MDTLRVPTINDDSWSFGQLFRLWHEANGDGRELRIDFSSCGFLRQNAVAFLGGLARLVEHRGGRVEFAWDTLPDKVGMNLAQNGFKHAFGMQHGPWSGNSIPYREDSASNPHAFENYLSSQWLGRGWIGISAGLRDAIVGPMAETYLNAFEHSESPTGLFTCGQHFPRAHELNLTIVDFGVGIPSNVRLFLANEFRPEDLSAQQCMEWAFRTGTSTKPSKIYRRGLGLDLLASFVRKTGGRMEFFSHEGHVLIDQTGHHFAALPIYFEGTLVNIQLRCDEKYYCLPSELPSGSLF